MIINWRVNGSGMASGVGGCVIRESNNIQHVTNATAIISSSFYTAAFLLVCVFICAALDGTVVLGLALIRDRNE